MTTKVTISLSPDGSYFAIFNKKKNNLFIYDTNNDFEDLLERIGNDE